MVKNGFKSIRVMIRYSPVQTILVLVMMMVASAFTALSVHINKNLVDSVSMFVTDKSKVYAVCFWIGLLFLSILFGSFQGYFGTQVNIAINRNLTKRFVPMIMEKLNKTEFSAFEDPDTHNLIERMSNSPQSVIINCFNNLIQLSTCIFSMLGIIIYFFNISFMFTIVYILIAMIYCYFNMLIAKQYLKLNDKKAECKRRAVYYNNLLTQKDSLAELHILNGENYVLGKWKGYVKKLLQDLFKVMLKEHAINFMCGIILCIWTGFMLVYTATMVLKGNQTPGFFVAVMTSIGTLSGITRGLSWAYSNFVSSSLSYDYFERFLHLPERQMVDHNIIPESMEIRFEDVYFKYPGTDIQILKGVSFTLKENERISIVGENGAGKSTIIKLLCGLYKPDSGKIYVGEYELDHLSDQVMKKLFSVVFQDFGHYSMTLRENIAFGDIQKIHNDEAITKALTLAMAEGLIEKGENGLDINLGKLESDGIDLSGGQWQRVAIARAFFSGARYVILDEPTASLDPLAECRMYEAFVSVLKNRGAITISHRLASAKLSDRILVISEGKITEQGSHDELMEINGLYAEMFASQASWYDGTKVKEAAVNV